MTTARPYVLTPDTAPNFWQIRNLWRVVATGVQTGGSFCALDQLVTTDGGGPPTHTHTQDEGLYVVSGHCVYDAGGETLEAPAGSFVAIPRHTEHSFVVDAPGTQLLNFYLPAGFELILIGLSVPAERQELPPPEVPLPPRQLVEQLSRDYGQGEVLGLPFADAPGDDNMATNPTPGAPVAPFLATAESAPAYWFAGGVFSILADGEATDGSYCLFEQWLPHGPAASPHLHQWEDEVFYILDGEAEFLLGDRIETAPQGAFVFIPRSTVHAFQITSDTARLLNLYTPAGFERSVTTLGEPARTRDLPPADWRAPDVPDAQAAKLFEDIGMRHLAVTDPFSG